MTADQHIQQALLYLLPSIALAICIKALSGRFILFTFLTLAGTLCHELAHYLAGLLTNAQPRSLSIMPKRIDRHHYQMGSATFANLRWYNAAITALAPVMILTLPLCYAYWRVGQSGGYSWVDAGMTFILAPQFLCFWPSRTDWLIALRSWPYLLVPVCWYAVSQWGRMV